MFKNLIVYRLLPEWSATLEDLQRGLEAGRFLPCGATQAASAGWVPPRGDPHAPLVESIQGQWLMRLAQEHKLLPSSVVKRRAEEIAQQVEASTGRKPGRREGKEIREQAEHELLPQAFTKLSALNVWLAPAQRFLVIEAGSQKRAEEVVTLLVKALDGFAVRLLQTQLAPVTAMSAWLNAGETPEPFGLDRECELKAADDTKATVRYVRHGLDLEEIRGHLTAGKLPTRVALSWRGRVSFTLTEGLQLKKLVIDDGLLEGAQGSDRGDDPFDADAAIVTGELVRLLPDLIELLDGELASLS